MTVIKLEIVNIFSLITSHMQKNDKQTDDYLREQIYRCVLFNLMKLGFISSKVVL